MHLVSYNPLNCTAVVGKVWRRFDLPELSVTCLTPLRAQGSPVRSWTPLSVAEMMAREEENWLSALIVSATIASYRMATHHWVLIKLNRSLAFTFHQNSKNYNVIPQKINTMLCQYVQTALEIECCLFCSSYSSLDWGTTWLSFCSRSLSQSQGSPVEGYQRAGAASI